MSTSLDGPFKHIALLTLSIALVYLSPDPLVSGNEKMVRLLIHTFNIRQGTSGDGQIIGGVVGIEGQRKEENGAHF